MRCELWLPSDYPEKELRDIVEHNELCRNSILGKALEPCNQNLCKITALVTLQ